MKYKFIWLRLSPDRKKKTTKKITNSESLPVSEEVVVRVENGLKQLFVTDRAAGTVTGGISG